MKKLGKTLAQAVKRRTLMTEELPGGMLRYELFGDETDNSEYPVSYGVRITGRLAADTECAEICDVTENLEYAQQLFERLVLYTALPSELEYAAEDFLCEKYSV